MKRSRKRAIATVQQPSRQTNVVRYVSQGVVLVRLWISSRWRASERARGTQEAKKDTQCRKSLLTKSEAEGGGGRAVKLASEKCAV